MSTVATFLRDLPDGEAISLPWIGERIRQEHVSWSPPTQSEAIKEGVIHPLSKRGPHGAYRVSREEAILILVAAALAAIAGIALATMIRTLKGAELDPVALAKAMGA